MINRATVSLADKVLEKLEDDILSGVYPRGSYLTELKLIEDLGVSRTPVREALVRLEQEHIVESTTKGVLVIGVSEEDLEDIYEVRLHIEGICAKKASQNATEAQLADFKQIVELQEFFVDKGDAEKVREMDNKFHDLLYLSSGSGVYYDTLKPLHKKVQKYRKFSVQNHNKALESVKEHKAIYNAILSKDGNLAEKLTVEHVANAKKRVLNKTK